ncbi:MAG: BamA/TamA family outer membrane protein, partial [Deltaproteobacteria bacterium]|nr:BamA/TamA family outer membrane protein [Deltaproteobacteria bacterium]
PGPPPGPDPLLDPAVDPALDPADPAAFGPVMTIESIAITGNRSTAERVIRRALPIAVGDVVRASDPRLTQARWKVLALGFFREVKLELRRGTARGQVILVVTVLERGTVVLNRLWFGTSSTSSWWLGTDLEERNFAGTGIGVGAGFVYAPRNDVIGSRDQWAGEVRIADAVLGASRWGARAAFTVEHGSDPYRVAGDHSTSPDDFRAFSYRRLGGRAAATFSVTPLSRVVIGGRFEAVTAELPTGATRSLPDGQSLPVRFDLRDGHSRIATVSLAFDRDTRPNPALPREGSHLALAAEAGASIIGGSYDYATIVARYDRWWPIRDRQAIALRLSGGVAAGDAPRFDRIYVGDVDRMVAPRALGLALTTGTSAAILGTAAGEVDTGNIGGAAIVEWSLQLFHRKHRIYGGDIFVGAGLWGLGDTRGSGVAGRSTWQALPIDVVADAGLRIDTEIGIFELSLANALGRVAQ